MPGVNQTQVHPEIGLTFAHSLRAVLRQDPDVIMVGEIRDRETADIAIRASLTGHLVLSTLHTNDAPGALTRLTDMDIEPFLIASSVEMIIAQRLVRRLCPNCAQPASYDPGQIEGFLATMRIPLSEASTLTWPKRQSAVSAVANSASAGASASLKSSASPRKSTSTSSSAIPPA